MNKIDFTIIIPFHDEGLKIKNLFSSIDNQFPSEDLEVIVVDDNSVLQKRKELDYIVKKSVLNIRIISNKTNQSGAGACRNIGLKKSNGRWIIFADADDHFVDGFYSEIKKYRNELYDIVYFPPTSTDENGVLGHRHDTYLSYFTDYYEKNDGLALKYKLTVIWSRMFRRSFLLDNNIRCDADMVSNDVMFAIRAGIKCKSFAVSQKCIYSWDFNSNSVTTKMSREKFITNANVFIKSDFLLRENLSKNEYDNVRTTALKFIAMSLFRYKYGIFFTIKVASKFISNGIPLFSVKDIKLSLIHI